MKLGTKIDLGIMGSFFLAYTAGYAVGHDQVIPAILLIVMSAIMGAKVAHMVKEQILILEAACDSAKVLYEETYDKNFRR